VADEWGQDPSVRLMRKVFESMEAAQKLLLEEVGVSTFDQRVRGWREKARDCFERSWPVVMDRGLGAAEDLATHVYVRCLARVLVSEGVKVPADAVPMNDKVDRLLEDML